MSNELKITSKELIRKFEKSTYGGQKFMCDYRITTETNGIQNTYLIEAEIAGIESCDPHLRWGNGHATTNNEETVGIETLIDYLD